MIITGAAMGLAPEQVDLGHSADRARSAIQRLVYVSPKFPCISAVFEQNEILGLHRAGLQLRVLVCRPESAADPAELHQFAKPIRKWALYPRWRHCALGAARVLVQNPTGLFQALVWLGRAAGNPLGLPRSVAALCVALSYRGQVREAPEWIHADFGQNSATVALLLSAFLSVPFSYKVHAFELFDRSLSRRDPLRRLKEERAAVVFAISDFAADVVRKHGRRDPIVVNRCGIRTEDFRASPAPKDSRRFVALGRLVPKKGFDVLIDAVATLRKTGSPATLDIYGDGPDRARLNELVDRHGVGDAVRLLGRYRNDDLPRLLEDALGVVVPCVRASNGDMDGVPTVIYEAMALGRPVVASALSGIPEVVRHGETGLLVPPGDAAALAGALRRLLDERELGDALARNGRLAAETHHDSRRLALDLLRALRPPSAIAGSA